jgi:hypothetical protein
MVTCENEWRMYVYMLMKLFWQWIVVFRFIIAGVRGLRSFISFIGALNSYMLTPTLKEFVSPYQVHYYYYYYFFFFYFLECVLPSAVHVPRPGFVARLQATIGFNN